MLPRDVVAHVKFEPCLIRTQLTLERFLSRVSQEVSLQCNFLIKPPATNTTHKRTILDVNKEMLFEGITRGTRVAAVWTAQVAFLHSATGCSVRRIRDFPGVCLNNLLLLRIIK